MPPAMPSAAVQGGKGSSTSTMLPPAFSSRSVAFAARDGKGACVRLTFGSVTHDELVFPVPVPGNAVDTYIWSNKGVMEVHTDVQKRMVQDMLSALLTVTFGQEREGTREQASDVLSAHTRRRAETLEAPIPREFMTTVSPQP